jgi:hypothetical protein
MLWNIKAAENLVSGDFVEFITDRDGKLSCKRALELASISAIAARDIGEREVLTFDAKRRYKRFEDTAEGNLSLVKRSPLYPHFLFL